MRTYRHPRSRGGARARICAFAAVTAVPDAAWGNPLMGGVIAAGPRSGITIMRNPAHAGVIRNSEIEAGVGYGVTRTQARYPGFNAITKTTSGLSPSFPGFVYKITPTLGITALVAPPTPEIGLVKLDRIPVPAFGQVNFGDAQARGAARFYFQGGVGVRVLPWLSLGAQATYLNGNGHGTVKADGSQDVLLSAEAEVTDLTFGIGALARLYDVVTVGLAADIYTSSTLDATLESETFGALIGGKMKLPSGESGFLRGDLILGAGAAPLPALNVYADLRFRPGRSSKAFSIAELRMKPTDIHHTLGAHIGLEYQFGPRLSALGGYAYEPAAIGAGGRGPGSKIGFGTQETVMMFTGMSELTPAHALSGGMQLDFLPVSVAEDEQEEEGKAAIDDSVLAPEFRRKFKKKKATGKARRFYAWSIEAGARVRFASLGIDAKGELPAAYGQFHYNFPIVARYRF